MSLPWRPELHVGICPARLVLPASTVPAEDPVGALRPLARKTRVTAIVSNHFVRYAVLPWSAELTSAEDWSAFARHTFDATYGPAATGWEIRVSAAGRGRARLASAVDRPLIEALRDVPGITSVQPYLMAAFNARCGSLPGKTSWFVLHEAGRLAIGLIADGEWKAIRTRQAGAGWSHGLADILDRECVLASQDCDRVALWSDEDVPSRLGRYHIADVTLPAGAPLASRPYAMAVH